MKEASNVKFMVIINPQETPDLLLDLEIKFFDHLLKVKNITFFNDTMALKMNANYQILF